MSSLRPIADGEPARPELGTTLLHFLLDVRGGGDANYLKHLEASGSVPSSEEISTFAEIASRYDPAVLLGAFESLIGGNQPERAGENAWHLIEFFGDVESKALDRYSTSIQSRMV
jgi:hypothetical protein